jgi:sporulation protein YlmC with PRC-barrel domain
VRLTDFLGSEVFDRNGASIGRVHDVVFVQDGPPIGQWGAMLRLHSLLAGPSALGFRLGFGRSDVRGPWPVKALFTQLYGRVTRIAWSDIAAIEQGRVRLRSELEPPGRVLEDARPAGRMMNVGLELLDRQIVDLNGRMAGKVDDLELSPTDDGPPGIIAILAGPGALARRLGRGPGRWIAAAHDRLQDRHLEGPARISFGIVTEVAQHVRVAVPFDELPTAALEGWVRARIIERIPGS